MSMHSEAGNVREVKSCLPDADAAFPLPCGTASVACADRLISRLGKTVRTSFSPANVFNSIVVVTRSSIALTLSKSLIVVHWYIYITEENVSSRRSTVEVFGGPFTKCLGDFEVCEPRK